MEIFYTHKAAKQLENLPLLIQKRIAKKMRFYASQKDPLKFAKRLTYYYNGEYRFRIGEFRLTFDIKRDVIYILGVKARDKSYK